METFSIDDTSLDDKKSLTIKAFSIYSPNKLPAVVGKRFVGLGHPVGLFAFLDRRSL
jgi:hypothetical protein